MPKTSQILINDKFIKTLEKPTNTAHKIYWDGKTTGFGVRITQSGAVSFVLRYVLNGRERKYTIGNYPTHSALSARETAIKLKGEIAKGFDPLEERITDFNAYTLNELIAEYLQKMNGKLRENTLLMYKKIQNKHIIGGIGKQKVNILKRREIEVLLNSFAIEILLEMKASIGKQNGEITSTKTHFFWNTKTKKPLQDIKRV